MKIELGLTQIDSSRWRGFTKVDGEEFKVTLFPGSATTEWEAVLEKGMFVELEEGHTLHSTIKRAYESWRNMEYGLAPDEEARLLEVLESQPELLEKIKDILNGGGEKV